jgi:hypothetical protein
MQSCTLSAPGGAEELAGHASCMLLKPAHAAYVLVSVKAGQTHARGVVGAAGLTQRGGVARARRGRGGVGLAEGVDRARRAVPGAPVEARHALAGLQVRGARRRVRVQRTQPLYVLLRTVVAGRAERARGVGRPPVAQFANTAEHAAAEVAGARRVLRARLAGEDCRVRADGPEGSGPAVRAGGATLRGFVLAALAGGARPAPRAREARVARAVDVT